MICGIIKRNPKNAFDIIKSNISKNDFVKSKPENIVNEMIVRLRNINSQMAANNEEEYIEEFDFTDEEKFIEQYKKHFGNKKKREYSDMAEDFSADLEILNSFLVSASIPAICIEKPFVAKEVKSIESLMESVKSSDFTRFIRENMRYLIKDAYSDYQNQQREYMVNQNIIREIDSVLKTMSAD